jgi:hypothetical protein
MDTGYKRETLPQDLQAFKNDAAKLPLQTFAAGLACPCLLFVRSKLWDPLLLMASKQTQGESTKVVSYDMPLGGVSFLSPVRKRQTDPKDPQIYLGRAPDNDMVVPVATVSSRHASFLAPTAGGVWTITDFGSRNGTFIGDVKVEPMAPTPVQDGEYLRLGGNLIAWFMYPERLYGLLRNPQELSRLIDV